MDLNNIDNYIKTVGDKIINLKTVINLIKLHKTKKYESIRKMQTLSMTGEDILNNFNKLIIMKNKLDEMNKEIEIKHELCVKYTDSMSAYLESNVRANDSDSNHSLHQSTNEVENINISEGPPRMLYQPPLYRPKSLVFDVEELSANDFNSIPRYMIGTLTLTIINEFILYFNKTVTKKYSEKKKTTTYIEPELKKETFLTESDLFRDKKNCLTKQDEKILMILCNIRKLSLRRINTFGKRGRAYIIVK